MYTEVHMIQIQDNFTMYTENPISNRIYKYYNEVQLSHGNVL